MREIWKSAEEAVITGDVQKLDRLLRDHRQLLTENTPPPYVPRGPGPCYEGGDARSIIARAYHFESCAELEHHRDAVKRDEPVARLESAVDAALCGDVP